MKKAEKKKRPNLHLNQKVTNQLQRKVMQKFPLQPDYKILINKKSGSKRAAFLFGG
jgi:hypothetical protein